MSKPFFYRITAADFLAAVVTVPEADRAAWVLSLALDMVSGDADKAKSSFAKDIIIEAGEFSNKKREAANKRWDKKKEKDDAQNMQTDAVHIHSNASNRSSNSTEAVTVTVTEQGQESGELTLKQVADKIKGEIPSLTPSQLKGIKKWLDEGKTMADIEQALLDTAGSQRVATRWKWIVDIMEGRSSIPKGVKKESKQPAEIKDKDDWLKGGFKDATM